MGHLPLRATASVPGAKHIVPIYRLRLTFRGEKRIGFESVDFCFHFKLNAGLYQ
jgi:hypothetical protein